MLYLALFLLLAGLVLLAFAWRQRRSAGLPGGRIISADMQGWGKVEEPLYDPVLGLVGRPDYLVQQGQAYIPVEVKSSRVTDAPHDGHVFQLAVYCMLVERIYGKRPSHGILHYPNRTFAIDFTPALENAVLDTLNEMRQQEGRKDVRRSHDSPARCRGCGYRSICDQNLTD